MRLTLITRPRESLRSCTLFLVQPQGSFEASRIYETREAANAVNQAVVVEDSDTVIILRDFLAVMAAPGYELRYVWALYGTKRTYGAWSDDPAHVCVRDGQAPPK
ncbi:MAG: 5-deoxy-glucuronate isomerase [Ktedonobacterales bacterium]